MSHPTPSIEVAKLIRITCAARHVGNVKRQDGKWIDLMTPHALQIVLEVAQQPGITMKQLSTAAGLAHASISRNLMALGERHRRDMPGLGLIETIDDPQEYRRKVVFLTRKGRTFVSELVSIQLGEKVVLSAPTAKEFLSGSTGEDNQKSVTGLC
ncbi:MarR family winged helix-turn-helix transcriptional regulator [Methylobacterium sp. Leaf111]|uniref:MarR family winged helix-turn-helix transcriptional regulator n=1 Tax=Methylobacterium sp. Leaf111 TaxID=1736257 RepID=UPI000A97A5F9|nr:MarR family winged helix-turn-helix transcriptional regulator [Methylobacterium sp. Leaf111]